jgi:flagellin
MISLNTNTAASYAAYNLGNSTANLQRSLNKLSSGTRINSSFDDAGGLAVSMRLNASIRRTEATQANVNNAISLLQTQDGVLKNAEKVVSRMAELVHLSTDITKTTADRALYQTEFLSLQTQLASIQAEAFNGISLFSTGGIASGTIVTTNALNVVTSQDGGQTVAVTQLDFGSVRYFAGTGGLGTSTLAGGLTVNNVFQNVTTAISAISTMTNALQNLATIRANNGAEQNRFSFAADLLAINKVNLEAANGRIVDLDIAAESANLAKLNILQQAGTAMLAQANQSQQSLLRLLV